MAAIVHREDFNENPPRVEYSLKEAGIELFPIIEQLGAWGKQYNSLYDYGTLDFDDKYEDKC